MLFHMVFEPTTLSNYENGNYCAIRAGKIKNTIGHNVVQCLRTVIKVKKNLDMVFIPLQHPLTDLEG